MNYLCHHFIFLVVRWILQSRTWLSKRLVRIRNLGRVDDLRLLRLVRDAVVDLSDQVVVVLVLLLDHGLASVYFRLGVLRPKHSLNLVEKPALSRGLLLGCACVAAWLVALLHVVGSHVLFGRAIRLGQSWDLQVTADVDYMGSAHACSDHDLVAVIRCIVVHDLLASHASQMLNLIRRQAVFDVGELLVIIIVIVRLVDLFLKHGVLLIHMLISEDLFGRASVMGTTTSSAFDLLGQSLVHPVGVSGLGTDLVDLLSSSLVDSLLVSSNR